jgi:prepilin-type N-terminal cleavage/methylation domain-containing protein
MGQLKKRLNQKGYSLLEMTLVMALLVLFSLATLTLVVSGGGAYKSIVADKDTTSELRIAKVRQNDVKNAVELRVNPYGEGQALVISEQVDKVAYETWVYFHRGKLREALVRSGTAVTDEVSFDIVSLDGFELQSKPLSAQINVKAWRNKDKERREANTFLTLRTEHTLGGN